jgi:hypothetical protein
MSKAVTLTNQNDINSVLSLIEFQGELWNRFHHISSSIDGLADVLEESPIYREIRHIFPEGKLNPDPSRISVPTRPNTPAPERHPHALVRENEPTPIPNSTLLERMSTPSSDIHFLPEETEEMTIRSMICEPADSI